jgi:RecA/RadA recombinase
MPIAEIRRGIAQFRAKENKSAKGAPVVASIEDVPNTYFLRRPCGIMQLDIDTGGGLPAGGLCYVSGPDNAGKSYLLAKYIAMNQRLLGERSAVAIGLSEGAPDHWFWRKAGVKVAIPDAMIEEENKYRKDHGLKTFSKEELKELKTQVGEIAILRHATGEKLLETVLGAIETKCFDIVGLDSVSALLSESEATKDLDENPQQAAVATSMTRFFQHYLTNTTGFYGRNDTTVIFTAQARSNRKKSEAAAHFAKYMKDWTTQGAWAARHGKLIDITVWSGGKEKEEVKGANELEGEKNKRRVAVGKDICWEISKGKAGTHDGITGEIGFSYDTMTDDLRSIVAAGFRYGSIREKEGLITVIRRATCEVIEGMQDLAGVDRLTELMREDFETELFVRREVLAAAGIRCTYR